MTRTEELIARAQKGDPEAVESLVVENSGLIWSVAKRFLGRGVEADDLYQLGCLGFLKAVDGFDLAFGEAEPGGNGAYGVHVPVPAKEYFLFRFW